MESHEIKFLSAIDLVHHQQKKQKDKKDNLDDRCYSNKSNLGFAYKEVLKRVRREITNQQVLILSQVFPTFILCLRVIFYKNQALGQSECYGFGLYFVFRTYKYHLAHM